MVLILVMLALWQEVCQPASCYTVLMDAPRALPGGANIAATTAGQAVNVSAFAGADVLIFCPTQDVLFSAALDGSNTTLVTAAQAVSTSALVADRAPAGFGKVRKIFAGAPFLIVALAASTGTITIKPV